MIAGGADPSALVDEYGNTVLHNAQTAEEITGLLKGSLVDVNVTNKVRRPSLSPNTCAPRLRRLLSPLRPTLR